jgi:hypothetical protein
VARPARTASSASSVGRGPEVVGGCVRHRG